MAASTFASMVSARKNLPNLGPPSVTVAHVPAGQIPLGANSGIRWVISRARCGAMQSMASASYADDQARSSEGEKRSEPQARARRLLTSVGDPGLFKALRPSPQGVYF